MSAEDTRPTIGAQAEEAFAAWLLTHPEDDADIEPLCVQRPELAGTLRLLRDEWRALLGVAAFRTRVDPPAAPVSEAVLRTAADGLEEVTRWRGNPGRYVPADRLGEGGMGEVLRVWDRLLRRHLAMKVVKLPRPEGAGATPRSPDASRRLARFLREARILGRLQHPAIIAVHDIGLDEQGRLALTMPLVQGSDLGRVLQDVARGGSEWSLPRLLGVLQRASEAVAHAHDQGVVHRDLKPSNLMVGRYGETYVMDWGLARLMDEPPEEAELGAASADEQDLTGTFTSPGQAVGTAAYMAPEQARGERDAAGPAADIYSLGAILHHLLAGHAPYGEPGSDTSWQTVLRRVVAAPPPPLPAAQLPAELIAICERAMARRREERYGSALELAADLRAYLEHRVVSAYETGAVAELRKWVVRNRPLAAALGTGVLLLVAGLTSSMILKAHADDSAALARANADVAEERRQQAETRLAESHVKSAQLAAQRGAWRQALVALDQALDLGRPDEAALRLAKARAFSALAEPGAARLELELAARAPDAAATEGQRLLVLATLASLDPAGKERSQELLQQALEHELPEAEQAYALALLADTAERARALLWQAVKHDPFHHLAWTDLLVTLFWMQRLDEAREVAGRFGAAFPEDPTPPTFEVLLTGMEDVSSARRMVESLRAELGETGRASLIVALDILALAREAIDADALLSLRFGGDGRELLGWAALPLRASALIAADRGEADPDALAAVTGRGGLRHLAAFASALRGMLPAMLARDLHGIRAATEEALAHNPFLEIAVVHGMAYLGTEVGRSAEKFMTAADLFRDARAADGFIPEMVALAQALELNCLRAASGSEEQAGLGARVRALLLAQIDRLDASAAGRDQLMEYAIHFSDPVASELLAGTEERLAPKSYRAWRARMWAESTNRRWARTAEAAEAVLALEPGDEKALLLGRLARERLREESEGLTPSLSPDTD